VNYCEVADALLEGGGESQKHPFKGGYYPKTPLHATLPIAVREFYGT